MAIYLPNESYFSFRFISFFFGFPSRITKAHQSDEKMQVQIYEYLENVLPYNKQQLLNERNEYAIQKIENEVRIQERNVQKDINQIMPGVKERYEMELKKVEEQRSAYQGSEKPEHQFRNPRRRFPWNDNLRYFSTFDSDKK